MYISTESEVFMKYEVWYTVGYGTHKEIIEINDSVTDEDEIDRELRENINFEWGYRKLCTNN